MRLGLLLMVLTAFPGTVAAQATLKAPARTCAVTNYGAKGTRVFLDTLAFQRAIDDCASRGGGRVEVPRGEYLIGPIFLKSNIDLHLAANSELVGITDEAPYKVTPSTKAYVTNANWIALINIADAENVSITGPGRIDGQGSAWWDRWRAQARQNRKGGGTNRPRLVHATRSRNLVFEGVELYNSPSFHLVLKDSEDIVVRGMSFVALAHSPNTDAIDPIDVRNVVIEENWFDTGDDVVAIKSMKPNPARPDAAVDNIVIRGNRGKAGRGICIGSETVGGIRNVLIEDNELNGAMYGIRIKTPRGRGGVVQDIVFRNNRMTDVETPIVFSSYYEGAGYDEDAVAATLKSRGGFVLGHQIYPPDNDPAQPYQPNSTPWIRNLTVDGLTATGADRAGIVVGLPERAIEGVTFKNVRIQSRRGMLVRHAEVDARGLQAEPTEGTAVTVERGAKLRR